MIATWLSFFLPESAFSSSAQAIVQKPLVLENNETPAQLFAKEFNDYYELEWTANELEIFSKNHMRMSAPSSLRTRRAPSWKSILEAPHDGPGHLF